jgi:hypothetical protein
VAARSWWKRRGRIIRRAALAPDSRWQEASAPEWATRIATRNSAITAVARRPNRRGSSGVPQECISILRRRAPRLAPSSAVSSIGAGQSSNPGQMLFVGECQPSAIDRPACLRTNTALSKPANPRRRAQWQRLTNISKRARTINSGACSWCAMVPAQNRPRFPDARDTVPCASYQCGSCRARLRASAPANQSCHRVASLPRSLAYPRSDTA